MLMFLGGNKVETKQHKWHKEIKAWSDGVEIEAKEKVFGEWLSISNGIPNFYNDSPNWNEERLEFRIKPQPKEPKYLYVYLFNGTAMLVEAQSGGNGGRYIGKIEVQDD